MIRLRTVIAACLLMVPFATNASLCQEMTNKINSDLTAYAASIQQKHLPWMSLSWVQRRLGNGHEMKVAENQIQYEWRCGEETDAVLFIQTNQEKAITNVHGVYSSNEGSGLFSMDFNPPIQPVASVKKIAENQGSVQKSVNIQSKSMLLAQGIKEYNQRFNTAIQNLEQLRVDITAKVRDYAANLRLCKPGVYRYAIPGLPHLLFFTSLIQGQQNNRCLVDSSYQQGENKMLIKCHYRPESLGVFTDEYVESLVGSGGKKVDGEMEKMVASDCETFMDGKKA